MHSARVVGNICSVCTTEVKIDKAPDADEVRAVSEVDALGGGGGEVVYVEAVASHDFLFAQTCFELRWARN